MPIAHTNPSREEVVRYLTDGRNWGRWGADDQRGAINLITPEKRIAAARLVRTGRSISLSRDFPKDPGPDNPHPAQHFMRWHDRGDFGAAYDYYGIMYHGSQCTHIDALCHCWGQDGMWGGRDPNEMLTPQGALWGDIDQWADGIVTRGVLLDIPRLRGESHVTVETPIHGWELAAAAEAQGVEVDAGDALVVYGGRDSWEVEALEQDVSASAVPGLHASCLPFIRDHDVSVVVWDFADATPNEYGMPYPVHGALYAYGVALIDNARLGLLAEVCQQESRYEFMLTVAPLRVKGGTGSPVNPLVLL